MELFVSVKRDFYVRPGLSNPSHPHRHAVGLKQQFVLAAVVVCRAAGNTGDLSVCEVANLRAESDRVLNERHRQAVDLRAVFGIKQHAVDGEFVQIIFWPPAVFPRERDDVATVRVIL